MEPQSARARISTLVRVMTTLATMAAIVQPDTFEQLTEYGFEGLPSAAAG